MTRRIGEQTEKLARQYLEQQGLQFITNNFHSKQGEIDLVMRDQSYVVFVEVRYRQYNYYGDASESIDWFKQQRIMHAADFYLHRHLWAQQLPSRFDVVSLSGDVQSPTIQWISDAF